MGTQMQLKVLFGRKSHGRPDFWKEKSRVFFGVMCTLTWITEKELERVIKNSKEEKHDNSKRR